MKRVCRTCERIGWLQGQAKQHKSEKKIRNILHIVISEETMVDGIFAGQLNIKCGRMLFCPECGRKLKKSETMFDCPREEKGNGRKEE